MTYIDNFNYSIPAKAFDINNASTFNPACLSDINKIISRCTDFKINVLQTMNLKFLISVIVLCVLVLYQIQNKYRPFKFQESEFYKKYIDYRVDLVISILLIFDIFFILMM